LRAARQNLHLSLAQVAGERYSTSLISQIERNRVDPSQESLHYLSDRLRLPFEELQGLARQHRESETEATLYRTYEERYAALQQLLQHNHPAQALEDFKSVNLSELPLFLRWRVLALRGQAYFEQRVFSKAQQDFQSALTILPASPGEEYQLEVVKLHLHLAEAARELNQFEAALEEYQTALAKMSASTSLRYVAEAHWGLALVYTLKAQQVLLYDGDGSQKQAAHLLQDAWQHADSARTLYGAIADTMHVALLQCQLAQIEQAQGRAEAGRSRLLAVLEIWQPTLTDDAPMASMGRPYQAAERANVVSAAACYLADIEYQAQDLDKALEYVQMAVSASQRSYRVRQAEAFIMQGRIVEAKNPRDPSAEQAFKQAVAVLQGTDRRAIRSQAHYQLGRYLLNVGKALEGDREMERARELAGIPGSFCPPLPSEEQVADSNG
jgi:tetratricopeptide (TPR) repeat protein